MNKNVGIVGNKSKVYQERIMTLIFLMTVAFIVRIICAVSYMGFEVDVNCFIAWSDMAYNNGVTEFYSQSGNPYPPLYILVLWVIGAIRSAAGLVGFEAASLALIKMPAILCDLGIGYIIYRVASKYTNNMNSTIITAAFLFNPAVIIDSATWGQTDSVFTLFVVLMCYFITEKRLPAAYFSFALGILMKPQMLIFAPVLIFGIIDQVFLNNFEVKRMLKELGLGLLAILSMILISLPFGFTDTLSLYVDTLGSFEYASVNAYNFWAMLGFNWYSQDDTFLFMPFKNWGSMFIIITVAVSVWIWYRCKENESRYYLTGAFIIAAVFTLSVRMHERYMFPVLALLLLGAAVKRNYRYFVAYALASVAIFLNVYHVLFYYDATTYDFGNPVIKFISAVNVFSFVYLCIILVKHMKTPRAYTKEELIEINNQKNTAKKTKGKNSRNNSSQANANRKGNNDSSQKKESWWRIKPSDVMPAWNKWDTVIVVAITVVYACIAYYNLGDMKAPETYWQGAGVDDEIVLDFGQSVDFQKMDNYLGFYEGRKFEVDISDDGVNWIKLELGNGSSEDENVDPSWMLINNVFCWNEQAFDYTCRYVKFIEKDDKASVMEMMFYDSTGNAVVPVNSADYPELFDEQDIFDGKVTFSNSTYFDEIYHARTAYELIHGMYCYEWTHPPLGKEIIAVGVMIFGMNPFGWRFMGTLFGVLMIPVMYLIGRKLTKKTWLASVTTLLMTFDFMHFAQTRISTIDVYVTFFIMLMYYFMLCYYKMSYYDTPLKKTFIPLALSGVSMGLACASKWTGVYGAAGLAVIFAVVMLRRFMEYRIATRDPEGESEGISHRYIVDNYSLYTIKTLLFCLVVFVIVPLIIYSLSYIPFSDGTDRGFVDKIIENQKGMYGYHSNLVATHPYESTWFQWPLMGKPILYYVETLDNGLKSGISSFGNPLVWWVGLVAFIYMLYLIFEKKDRVALFLAIGYMAEYLPWMLVSRCTFIYHYFPSVPFLVMMNGYGVYRILKNNGAKNNIVNFDSYNINKDIIYRIAAAVGRVIISLGVTYMCFQYKLKLDAEMTDVETITIRTTLMCIAVFILAYTLTKGVSNYVYISSVCGREAVSEKRIDIIKEALRIEKSDVVIYAVLTVGLFILFYPVLSGYPETMDYVPYVKWINSWALLF